jgi:PhnB protein
MTQRAWTSPNPPDVCRDFWTWPTKRSTTEAPDQSAAKECAMQLNPYLTFNGQCEAAIKFYAKVLGGKIEAMMTYGGSPMAEQTRSEWRNKRASDAPPDRYEAMKGIMVTLGIDDPAEAERIFHVLSENGTVQMPIQETFWARRFGMLVDQFGTPWMVNCEKAA